MKRRLL
jgi:hypothetical protein